MNDMTTLLRRELWEHRAITVAPSVFAALFIVVALLAVAGAIHVQVSDADVDVTSLLQRDNELVVRFASLHDAPVPRRPRGRWRREPTGSSPPSWLG